MPKRTSSNQFPLFDGGDTSFARTFETKDERDFKREQKRKHARYAENPVPATGPCCFRCRHWRPAQDGEAFGHCVHILIVAEPVWTLFHKGDVVTSQQVKEFGLVADFMRVNGGGGDNCSAFVPREEAVAA